MRLRTLGVLAAVPMALALALTGCSNGDKNEDAASEADAQGVLYAQCLRENGLDVEDPKPGENVRIQLEAGGSVTKEKAQEAQAACKDLNPSSDNPAAQQEMAEKSRKFSECMRENGVESFQDPEPGKSGVLIGGSDIMNDPDLDAAQRACQDLLTEMQGS
ncbi:MAG: hypothetical protein HOQ05_07255 [Corynebacteriales bacterium]|nr:hypothetical protein [Mycobacteriales bacterium]